MPDDGCEDGKRMKTSMAMVRDVGMQIEDEIYIVDCMRLKFARALGKKSRNRVGKHDLDQIAGMMSMTAITSGCFVKKANAQKNWPTDDEKQLRRNLAEAERSARGSDRTLWQQAITDVWTFRREL